MAPKNEAKLAELLRKVDNDPHAAAELLAVAADYLKAREPMPDALADYLADAFRQAARTKPPKNGKRIEDERINQLAHGLYMKRRPEGGRPPKDVPNGKVLAGLMIYGDKVEEEQGWRKKLADEHGVSKNKAKAVIQKARAELPKVEAEARENTREIMESNELNGIVRPR